MKRLQLIFAVFVFTLFSLAVNAQEKNVLTPDEFEKAIKQDTVQILDVRTPGEYADGHIKNTLLANWNDKTEFDRRISFVNKNKPVYVYCLGGGRSAKAAAALRSEGFKNVFELQGGMNAWKAANKTVEGQTTTTQMSLDAFNAIIKNHKTVLVDFGAVWCPPCKTMEPILQKLQKNNSGKFTLLKVDGGKDENVMKEYKVTALPVFIIFKDGKPVWRKDGVATEQELAKALK